MPGRTSRTVVHIIRAATYGGQGVETESYRESERAPVGLSTVAKASGSYAPDPKGTAPPPDPT